MRNFAELIIKNRIFFLIVVLLVTVFFLFRLSKLPIKTNFADLLPQKNSFVKVHNKIRNIFGGATEEVIHAIREVHMGERYLSSRADLVRFALKEGVIQV